VELDDRVDIYRDVKVGERTGLARETVRIAGEGAVGVGSEVGGAVFELVSAEDAEEDEEADGSSGGEVEIAVGRELDQSGVKK
jgi:hypothetical protein